jgi:hypothetical protein
MKKIVMLLSSVVLIAGLTFAQTPQKKDEPAKPSEKKECGSKEEKSGCDKKTREACGAAKKGSSCTSKDVKKDSTATTTPKKK